MHTIVARPSGDQTAAGVAPALRGQMHLGGQAASGTPHSRGPGPPCLAPPAEAPARPCGQAGDSHCRGPSAGAQTRAPTPRPASSASSVYGGSASGRSAPAGHPLRKTHRAPLTDRRVSPAVRPRAPALSGRKSFRHSQCGRLHSYRFAMRPSFTGLAWLYPFLPQPRLLVDSA